MATTPKIVSIQKLANNPASIVVVSIPGAGNSVNGFIIDAISVDGNASYNTPLYSGAQEGLNDNLNRLKAVPGLSSVIPNISPIEASQTIAAWTGTSKPVFNVRMIFVALDDNTDVRTPTLKLYRTVYPVGEKIVKGQFFRPPLDYAVNTDGTGKNTITVQIGRWFRGGGMIMKDVNFTFSKQTIKNGTPLYAEGSIQFEPYRLITYGEFAGYFIGSGG
jgi:hypothetical protein